LFEAKGKRHNQGALLETPIMMTGSVPAPPTATQK
jgi:hypothetical protein